MKFIGKIKSYFFRREIKTSADQLRDDFGEFPPLPLKCFGMQDPFTLVKVRGVGDTYWRVIRDFRLLVGIFTEEVSISRNKELDGFRISMQASIDEIKNIKINKRALKIIIKCFLLFQAIRLAIKERNKKGAVGLGYFKAVSVRESNIIVKLDSTARMNVSAESVISHEHIHLLQHKIIGDTHGTKGINNIELLITDEELLPCMEMFAYFLARHEVEARLHEIVLSYYRVTKQLPMTVKGFLELLAGSDRIGLIVIQSLEYAGIKIESDFIEYQDREPTHTNQLRLTLGAMDDDELICKFITEVLPIMYGNLIRCYGDEASSIEFTSTISRPNLYDVLYS